MASNSCMQHVLAVFCLYAVFAADGRTVKVSDLGFDANDATAIVQQALDSGAERVVVDRRAKPWVVGPLHVRSNTEILFEEGVQLMAKSGEFMPLKSSLVNVVCVTNVVLHGLGKGATLRRICIWLNLAVMASIWAWGSWDVRTRTSSSAGACAMATIARVSR